MRIRKTQQVSGVVANVVDNLTSTSDTDALSANQGKVLNDKSTITSATEPTGTDRTKYWFQKGKNLFDKDNFNGFDAYLNASSVITALSTTRSIYIPCQPSTTYTISKTAGVAFSAGSIDEVPTIGGTCNTYENNPTGSSITITTGASDIYLVVYYYLSTDTLTPEEIRASIQIEQNATATTYEAYVNPTMWILNSNDVYEVFMEKEEPQYINTGSEVTTNEYIDGKRIYRKRIYIGTLPNTSSSLTDTGILYDDISIIHMDGSYIGAVAVLPINLANPSAYVWTAIINTSDEAYVQITTATDRSSFSGYVTMYYYYN